MAEPKNFLREYLSQDPVSERHEGCEKRGGVCDCAGRPCAIDAHVTSDAPTVTVPLPLKEEVVVTMHVPGTVTVQPLSTIVRSTDIDDGLKVLLERLWLDCYRLGQDKREQQLMFDRRMASITEGMFH